MPTDPPLKGPYHHTIRLWLTKQEIQQTQPETTHHYHTVTKVRRIEEANPRYDIQFTPGTQGPHTDPLVLITHQEPNQEPKHTILWREQQWKSPDWRKLLHT